MADMMMEKEGIKVPASAEERTKIWGQKLPRGLTSPTDTPHLAHVQNFETVKFDVTNIPLACHHLTRTCCLGGWHRTTMELGADEMHLVEEDNCMSLSSRTPYGNLGAVDTETHCCCCTGFPDVAPGEHHAVTPGCGCSGGLVQKIADELQERKVKRGAIAQMKQEENIIV